MAERLSPTRQAMVVARIYEAVRSTFAHWEAIPDYDLDREFCIYIDEALGTPDRLHFDLATLRFVAGLNNGHTTFSDEWLWSKHGAPIGFDAQWKGDGWFITRSAVLGLEPGERLAEIEGEPVEAFAEAKLAYVSGSSLRERRRRLFSRPYLFPRSFDVLTSRGLIHHVQRGMATQERSGEPKGWWIDPGRHFQLTIPSFASPEFEAAVVRSVTGLSNDVHLTIDVRGNAGGDTPCDLVAALMPVPYRFWRYTTPFQSGLERAQGISSRMLISEASWIEPTGLPFEGTMTILVDGGTFSAAEDFVLPFKDNGRAQIVGEPTGGSSGQPYVCNLDGEMHLWISTKRQYLPDGGPFEGVGLLPDVEASVGDQGHADRRRAWCQEGLRHPPFGGAAS